MDIKKIKFINTTDVPLPFPKPTKLNLPEWYKSQPSYTNGVKTPDGINETTATVKKCMPVFDALTAGYLITTSTDIYVKQLPNKGVFYEWKSLNHIGFQGKGQFEHHPEYKGNDLPKVMSPWAIKTPKGYSCLFLAPMHRENVITVLPAIVDTDSYVNSVNLPFTLTNPTFEGIIPSGTPICQVIPFKREKWITEESLEDHLTKESRWAVLSVWFDAYKNKFWDKKQYD